MDVVAFYATASGLCFALLGFWWLVVQFRHTVLTREPGPRHFAFLVSLHFVIPGLVSLASLLSSGALWRVAFGIAGVTGIVTHLAGIREATGHGGPLRRISRFGWVAMPLYVFVTIIAAVPDVARRGLGLEPLQLEGYALVFIVLAGIILAWMLFTDPVLASGQVEEDAG